MEQKEKKMEVWCAGEEWCPVTSTATLIGNKWHPVIIHRLLKNDGLGFNDLKKEVDGISSKVLSDTLEDLTDKNLVNRDIINEKPIRVKYTLTEFGESLEPVIMEMEKWGKKHLEEPESMSE